MSVEHAPPPSDDAPPATTQAKPSKSERFKNYLFGIGAISGLILGLLSQFKGEPVAQKTWDALSKQVNTISDAVNRLSRRVIFLQAHESGRMSASLHLKLEEADKKIARLEEQLAKKSAAPDLSKPKSQSCKKGSIPIAGKCVMAPKAIRQQLMKDAAEKALAIFRLTKERKLRQELERKKLTLKQMAMPKAPASLKRLPSRLDDLRKNFD